MLRYEAEKNMHVLSYNIHKGFTSGNRTFVLDEIRNAIRSTCADIVCLQEVVGENSRHSKKYANWISSTQFEFLADQMWGHHAYGQNALYDHGHHGNAILSKYPFISSTNHNISIMPMSERGVLHAVTEQHVHIVCVHFGLVAWERRAQLRKLKHILSQLPNDAPLVLAGDFNDWDSHAHRALLKVGLHEVMVEKTGKLSRTFPAWWPILRMDRIYYRNLTLIDAQLLHDTSWQALSDHCGLLAEFML
jgi:endonuclease/exonuclease/phosphatase family metal-dependent hydrolase